MSKKNSTLYTPHNLSADDSTEYPIHVSQMTLSHMYMNYVRWHWHEELEFNIICSGNAELYIGSERILFTKGQGFMINQNVLHSIHSVFKEKCIIYSISIHPSYLFGHESVLLSSKYKLPVLESSAMRYLVLNRLYSREKKILERLENIILLNINKFYGYEIYTKSELCFLWLDLLMEVKKNTAIPSVKTSICLDETRVKTAMKFIHSNYMLPLSLEEISESAHLSKSECCRCFKRTLNLTPFEYLMRYRIYISVLKIQKKDPDAATIASLAAAVGFNNTSYFNKLFKEFIHCTPNAYKRSISSRYPLSTDVLEFPLHFE